jgi:hypothetical protein
MDDTGAQPFFRRWSLPADASRSAPLPIFSRTGAVRARSHDRCRGAETWADQKALIRRGEDVFGTNEDDELSAGKHTNFAEITRSSCLRSLTSGRPHRDS